LSDFEILQQRPTVFYDSFERKGELQSQTHYCPGCGPGIVQKLSARAIDQLGVQDETVLVSPVGCSVFAYYYFDVGNVQAAHGRAPAVATAVKRALPGRVVIAYQGDGDLAAIGTAEIVHAANRGEPFTVIFVNNAIYGMTGGQVAPTTPIGEKTITSPTGRSVWNEGYPLHICEMLSQLDAPVYIERVALGNSPMTMCAGKAIRKALENQIDGIGFSLIEVLSPCPTIWKMPPVDAQTWVREKLTKFFPLGVYRDRTADAPRRPEAKPSPQLLDVPRILRTEIDDSTRPEVGSKNVWPMDFRMKIAGFGGQGVLLLGEILAEAGIDAGLHVSWLPSYGPEMRSGTSHCHVRLSTAPVDSPVVAKPNLLIAMNEPSLRKFLPNVQAGGWVFYNGTTVPNEGRSDVHTLAHPFSAEADALGDTRVMNMVVLGAVLETTNLIQEEFVANALRRLVTSKRWVELDLKAIARGREVARSLLRTCDEDPVEMVSA
jgi:2-oxoisovalerate ferredoxin oxidoreductase beta subunit